MENQESRDVYALVLIEGQGVSEEALTISTRGYWAGVVGSSTFGVVLDVGAVSASNWNQILERLREVPGVERVLTLALRL